jgi:hypothetical protein
MNCKTFDTYRAHLAKSIDLWCCTQHIERDKSIYLPAKFFENLITLRFNLGGPVTLYESVARGISMLACRSLSPVEAEYQWGGYKEVTKQTKQIRTIKELLRVNKGKIVTPPLDYMQLKLNIGSYCALLWSLFGKECDYYKELLKIHRILDREECFTI